MFTLISWRILVKKFLRTCTFEITLWQRHPGSRNDSPLVLWYIGDICITRKCMLYGSQCNIPNTKILLFDLSWILPRSCQDLVMFWEVFEVLPRLFQFQDISARFLLRFLPRKFFAMILAKHIYGTKHATIFRCQTFRLDVGMNSWWESCHDSWLYYSNLKGINHMIESFEWCLAGLSNIRSFCNIGHKLSSGLWDSVSINRDKGLFGSTVTATHEMAHGCVSKSKSF